LLYRADLHDPRPGYRLRPPCDGQTVHASLAVQRLVGFATRRRERDVPDSDLHLRPPLRPMGVRHFSRFPSMLMNIQAELAQEFLTEPAGTSLPEKPEA